MLFAIMNGTILVGNGEVLEGYTILMKKGKFTAIAKQIDIPDYCFTIDARNKFITPGLIDVHTHLGVHEQGIGREGHDFNETSAPITPQVRALDGINPFELGFQDARNAGVTTVQILPGSANVIGGEMVVVKTKQGVVDDIVIQEPSGLKAALGENPKRFHGGNGKEPVTRMGIASLLRETLIRAQAYIHKQSGEQEIDRDVKLEYVAKVLNQEIPLRIHAHRADDIMTALRIRREFDIPISIEHCTEGHKVIPHLKKSGVRVAVGPTMTSRSKVELNDKGFHTLLALEAAEIPFSITTDHPVVEIEHLMTSAILAIKHGVKTETALQAITLNAAAHLGIEERVGSIEVGKDADLVIWDGDPFDLRSNIDFTFIDGEIVYKGNYPKE